MNTWLRVPHGLALPPSQAAFALAIVGVGICGLAVADFVAAWQPVPASTPGRQALAYLCAVFCLATGVGLLWRRGAALASSALLAALLPWMIVFRLPAILRAPADAVSYESWGECAVMLAAAWMIRARCAVGLPRPRWRFVESERGVRVASSIFGLALIAFGVAHFAYARDTAALVPSWLPAHAGWVYATGIAYVVAGAAVLSGLAARPAAILAAWQMGLFTLLIWLPAVATRHAGISQWSEFLDSWALAAGAWVAADSCRSKSGTAAGWRCKPRHGSGSIRP